MTQQVSLTCPVCGNDSQQEIELIINGHAQPLIKKDLLEGRHLAYECDNCGASRQIETNLIYYDPSRQYLILLVPYLGRDNEAVEAQMNQVPQLIEEPLEGYQLRVVQGGADLIEKIQVFEDGLDDYRIELVKMLTDGLFAQEYPGVQVNARYYYHPADQKDPKFLYLTDTQQYLVDFHQSLVTFIEGQFKQALADQPTGQFQLINHQWASQALQNK